MLLELCFTSKGNSSVLPETLSHQQEHFPCVFPNVLHRVVFFVRRSIRAFSLILRSDVILVWLCVLVALCTHVMVRHGLNHADLAMPIYNRKRKHAHQQLTDAMCRAWTCFRACSCVNLTTYLCARTRPYTCALCVTVMLNEKIHVWPYSLNCIIMHIAQ